ncbi:DUF411 domain-containing protein [Hyphomicrobium sp.]|uniref:DUF411 domain-containing protein n=1 Tax=Hyphomicrobium sp. TaxID=82 RepID=UPI000FC2C642|nr:DUF411 domain-containing protein [Hyphomicrobium sp.]RUO98956.1 MAG: DUF411 domain-containing protein [Hyphomicrobium sp.]
MNAEILHYRRREMLRLMAAVPVLLATNAGANPLPVIEVYKNPSCGCCGRWVQHLKSNGFIANINEAPDMSTIKARFRVPQDLASCHTAIIAGYVIEGHVPAHAIRRLLAERPQALGLAVPGMPVGSPGMEGSSHEAFDVFLFTSEGSKKVFEHYD